MDLDDANFLSPEQKLSEREVIARCINLMRDERSRYEQQAQIMLTDKFFSTKNEIYSLVYSIQLDHYICDANAQSPLIQSFSIEVPIPDAQAEQIETLIELFAQSEVGLIN